MSGLGEAVDADHHLLSRLDAPHPLGLAAHQATLELVDRLEGPTECFHVGQLRRGGLGQLGRLGLDDPRALEDVVVLEHVGLEHEDLLHAQRPLLVPRPRQTQGFVPGRQLRGPGPGRPWTGSPRGSRERCAARCSRAVQVRPSELTCTP